MKQKTKLFSMLMVMMMVLGLSSMSQTAQAAEMVEVATEEALRQAMSNGSDIKLVADIALSKTITTYNRTNTIDGGGHTISLQNSGYRHFVVDMDSALTLKNVTLLGISDSSGGGGIVVTDSALTMVQSTITNCLNTQIVGVDGGGGVYAHDAVVIIEQSTISNCSTTYFYGSGGGLRTNDSTVTISDSVITDCHAYRNGGGMDASFDSAFSLTNSRISNCTAEAGAGINVRNNSTVNLTDNSIIANCTATSDGGGAHIAYDSSISSDETTRYEGNSSWSLYEDIEHENVNYACLSVVTSYKADGTPIYSGALNGYDIYWSTNMNPALYTITFESNGGTAVNEQSVVSGGVAEKPKKPARDGYTFKGWYTDSALSEEYDFSTPVRNSFTLYAGWIRIHNSYIEGYADKTFSPDSPVNRAEVAQMLYNIAGEMAEGTNIFSDVSSTAWYHNAVTYLSDRGIVSGYPDGTFDPDSEITRAELVKMVVSYAELAGIPEVSNSFPDVASDHWAIWYIGVAEDAGYIEGYPDGTFGPERSINRAETVRIINAMLERTIDESILADLTMAFTDVADTHWAYKEILEASVSHKH